MPRPTRLLLLSYPYEPAIGGIETVSLMIARGLAQRGYAVRVVTRTPGPVIDSNGVGVIRRPGLLGLVRALAGADVVVQSNVSLILAWPLLLRIVRRPWMVVNHTPIAPPGRPPRLRDRIKQWSLPRNGTFAVSRYLAGEIPRTRDVLPNPYDDRSFTAAAADIREDAVLFVGRLVRAKGVDVLIDALALLDRAGAPLDAVVIGDGPERDALQQQARALGVGERVRFLGVADPREVARAMRTHRVLVVPSRAQPAEALPVVGIEGLASGCVMVVTRQGGLPEAVGEAGLVVPPEDSEALARALATASTDDAVRDRLLERAAHELERFSTDRVIDRYVDEIERLRSRAGQRD